MTNSLPLCHLSTADFHGTSMLPNCQDKIAQFIYSSSQLQGIFSVTCTFSAFLCIILSEHGSHSDVHAHGPGPTKSKMKRVIISLFLELLCVHSYFIMTGVLYINFPLLTIQIKCRAPDSLALQFSNLLKGFYQDQLRPWPWEGQRKITVPDAHMGTFLISFPKFQPVSCRP